MDEDQLEQKRQQEELDNALNNGNIAIMEEIRKQASIDMDGEAYQTRDLKDKSKSCLETKTVDNGVTTPKRSVREDPGTMTSMRGDDSPSKMLIPPPLNLHQRTRGAGALFEEDSEKTKFMRFLKLVERKNDAADKVKQLSFQNNTKTSGNF